jgi:chromosome segregation ATPase
MEYFAAAEHQDDSDSDDADLGMTRDTFEMMATRSSPKKSLPSPRSTLQQSGELEKITQVLRATKKERSTLQSELAAQKIATERVEEEMKRLKYSLDTMEQEKELAVERAVAKAVADSQQRRSNVYREDKFNALKLAQVNIDESEELRVRLKSAESQLENITSKHSEADKRGKVEIRQLKDELDLAKDKAQRFTASEKSLARYKEKLEEMSHVKVSLEETEREHAASSRKVAGLELELAAIPTLQAQVGKFKARVIEMTAVVTDLKATVQDAQEEKTQLTEEVQHLEEENRDLKTQCDTARSDFRTLQSEVAEESAPRTLNDTVSTEEVSELKERLLQLEAENLRLAAHQGQGNMANEELQDEIHIAQSITATTEKKYLDAASNLKQLEAKLRKQAATLEALQGQLESGQVHLTAAQEAETRVTQEITYAIRTFSCHTFLNAYRSSTALSGLSRLSGSPSGSSRAWHSNKFGRKRLRYFLLVCTCVLCV